MGPQAVAARNTRTGSVAGVAVGRWPLAPLEALDAPITARVAGEAACILRQQFRVEQAKEHA